MPDHYFDWSFGDWFEESWNDASSEGSGDTSVYGWGDVGSDIDLGMDFSQLMGEGSDNTTVISPSVGINLPDTGQQDVGMATSAVGMMKELNRMMEGYKQKRTLIQTATRQKAIYTIDRFDGGINLNKSPRDLSYWEACQMDCMSPAKIGRLIKLGDFATQISASSGNGLESLQADDAAVVENYGLHYFKLSDSVAANETLAGETPTSYIATMDAGDVNIWNIENSAGTNDTTTPDLITSMHANTKAVYHDGENRLYVSDASFSSGNTYVCGITDRPNYFPFTHTDGSLKYNVAQGSIESDGDAYSVLIKDRTLYQAAPVAGITTAGDICVTTNSAGYALDGTTHQGIYMNVQFEDSGADDTPGTGWGGLGTVAGSGDEVKYYKFYASFLYDNGSETKLTDVTGTNNTDADIGGDSVKVTATTGTAGEKQKLVIKQLIIDAASFYTAGFRRVHGARFYYTVTNGSGNPIGDDKYLFAELDFRYGLKLVSEFGNWNLFENEDADGTTPTATELQYVQVKNAAETSGNTAPDGTLSIDNPPTAFTYYTINLFHQEEIKDDLMWKTSTVGNGIAFIGNVKYDGRQHTDTTLYSGAGETDSGSPYPMWGTFPVDSNRIDIPGSFGEITALKWDSGKLFQFREHAMYMVNVEDVTSPKVEGSYQGMGVAGPWAIAETPYGIAWINENGAYQYNVEEKKVRSLTIGRLDAEDFGADANSKAGYDDRAKMLIVTNTSQTGADGYHYAYSFVTDAWCTWNANKAHAANVKTNFAVDHDGYLTGAVDDGTALDVYRWNVSATGTGTIDYITKDIDMGKPSLDKRLYTLYISYTGGGSQSGMYVYFRINGLKGTELTQGWTQLKTIQDYTDPYGSTNATAWGGSTGSPTTGDTTIGTADDLDSTDQVASTGKYEQKLAKINLRHLVTSSGNIDDTIVDFDDDADRTALPKDYLKFARSIQFRIAGTAATTFEINDISLVFKDKRIK